MDRVIFHCDLNLFYASVELLDHPELRHKPTAVCGDPESRHGIILAKNEPAKAMGVRTAETIWQARRKCPELCLLPAHHETYRFYSQKVREIYQQYTDFVEPFGIDESWLDLTAALPLFGGDAEALADRLRREVRETLGLTISVGVSFNKVFAKLGSDYRKPDATTVFRREDVPGLIWPMPVTALLFVGRASGKRLASRGIHTIGDLAQAPREEVIRLLGRNGAKLQDYAAGREDSPVRPAGEVPPPKSVGNGCTFRRDLVGEAEVRLGVRMLSERVAARLRRGEQKCTTVQVTLRTPSLRTMSRQKKLAVPSNLAREIGDCALELIASFWTWSSPIRMITITGTGLLPEDEAGEQLNLFSGTEPLRREKQEKLERAMDIVREKYGKKSIGFAGIQTPEAQALLGGAIPHAEKASADSSGEEM